MCSEIMTNVSPRGERFKSLEYLLASLVTKNLKKINCPKLKREAFGEGFKSHKYMNNNIYIKIYINLSPIHPTHAYATRYVRTRIGRVKWEGFKKVITN